MQGGDIFNLRHLNAAASHECKAAQRCASGPLPAAAQAETPEDFGQQLRPAEIKADSMTGEEYDMRVASRIGHERANALVDPGIEAAKRFPRVGKTIDARHQLSVLAHRP